MGGDAPAPDPRHVRSVSGRRLEDVREPRPLPPLGGDRPGGLLRLASGLLSGGFLALLLAHIVRMGMQTGQWGWFWWTVCVLALTIAVAVAGHFYGPGDGSRPEDGSPAGRHPEQLGPTPDVLEGLSQNFAPGVFSGVPARDPEGQETGANEQDQRIGGHHGAATARLRERGSRGRWGRDAARGRVRGGPEPGGLARPGLRTAGLEVRIFEADLGAAHGDVTADDEGAVFLDLVLRRRGRVARQLRQDGRYRDRREHHGQHRRQKEPSPHPDLSRLQHPRMSKDRLHRRTTHPRTHRQWALWTRARGRFGSTSVASGRLIDADDTAQRLVTCQRLAYGRPG